MYNREDYFKALKERDNCKMYSKEWNLCQMKISCIATAMVASGDTWMVSEFINELYSLNDSGCRLMDKEVQFDLWVLESNGYEEEAKELRELFE